MKILSLFIISFFYLSQGAVGQIEPKEFRKVIEANPDIQIVDVRTLREYQSGYLENAVHIDFYREGFQGKILKLDANKPVGIYCAVGGRSNAAAQFLRQKGYKQVYDLKGGIFEWSKKGYKIIRK